MAGFERRLDQLERGRQLGIESLHAPAAAEPDKDDRREAKSKGRQQRERHVMPQRLTRKKAAAERHQDDQQHLRDAQVKPGLPHLLLKRAQEVDLVQHPERPAVATVRLARDTDFGFVLRARQPADKVLLLLDLAAAAIQANQRENEDENENPGGK